MADITRRTTKKLINQMLTKYQQTIEVCREYKTELSAEAIKIVNDYEKNEIGRLITKILQTEDYFSNYEAADLYKFFDNIRALLTGLDIKLPRDAAFVDGITDKEEIKLVREAEKEKQKKPINPKRKIKLQLLKGNEGEESKLSRLRYNIEWTVENIETKETKKSAIDAIENESVLFDQTDRSFTFKEEGKYKITAYVYEKDLWGRKELADVLSYEQEVVGENKILPETWKIYLDKNNQIKEVKYGPDKTKAQVINSNGNVGSVIDMTGSDYENKGFAKKLLIAAGITATDKADFELQEKMLDSGLFYINKKEGWIEKEKYFERMTPPDFLTIQDYKDVTVKAVYEDAKGELTFTYTAGGKTNKLFVIKASNNQKERQWPTASGNNVFPSDITDKKERKKTEMKTMPDDGTTPVDYIPGKFPKGDEWKITAFEKQSVKNSEGERINAEYGPYKIRTNAWREVEAWEEIFDITTQKKKWRKKLDSNGKILKTRDSGLLIHGGGWSESVIDNQKGSNKYTDTTLGCIRISNLDVLLIVKVLQEYLREKKYIGLEVK